MKTKAKLTLAISVMSAAVLAAGVTSTFAWFTTQETAKAAFSTLTVKSPSAISVTGYRVTKTAGALNAADGNGVSDTTHELGSVSSVDGKDFYAPTDLKSTERANDAANVTYAAVAEGTNELTNNKYCAFYKANLLVKAGLGEGGRGLAVTVENKTEDSSLKNAIRVGLYSTSAVLTPDSAETVRETAKQDIGTWHKVFAQTGQGTTGIAAAGAGNATGVVKSDVALTAFGDAGSITGTFTSATKDAYMHFVVSIWLEGTLGTKQNDFGSKAAAVDVTFRLV